MFKWTFVVQTVIWGKYNIGFGISIKFPSQSKKIVKSVHKQEIGILWSSESFEVDLESPSNFQVREKKIIEIGHETTKLCLN